MRIGNFLHSIYTDTGSFIKDHRTLCTCTFGLAIPIYILGNLTKKTIRWLRSLDDQNPTIQKSNTTANAILNPVPHQTIGATDYIVETAESKNGMPNYAPEWLINHIFGSPDILSIIEKQADTPFTLLRLSRVSSAFRNAIKGASELNDKRTAYLTIFQDPNFTRIFNTKGNRKIKALIAYGYLTPEQIKELMENPRMTTHLSLLLRGAIFGLGVSVLQGSAKRSYRDTTMVEYKATLDTLNTQQKAMVRDIIQNLERSYRR